MAPACHPGPNDLILVAEGQNPRYRLWMFPRGAGQPRLIFGVREPGSPPLVPPSPPVFAP